MKLSIIIPVYNEAVTVAKLLDQVLAIQVPGMEKELVIIEGASRDGTREIVRGYETRSGVKVVYEDRPRGKGAAVRAGLGWVTGDAVLVQDGDLEYSIEDYPKVIQPLKDGSCELVFGSRTNTSRQSWQFRRFKGFERLYGFFVNLGGVLFTGLFNLLYGTRISDGATMFKVYKADRLKALTLKSDGFDFDWELSAKMIRAGCRVAEVPVRYTARSRAEGKKIRFWRDGTRVLIAILYYRFCD